MPAIVVADPVTLSYLKKVGLDDELVNILKQENISDETAAVIKKFLTDVLLGLKGLGMPLDELAKSVQELEVKDEPVMEEMDPNAILNELRKLNRMLVRPDYAEQYRDWQKVQYLFFVGNR